MKWNQRVFQEEWTRWFAWYPVVERNYTKELNTVYWLTWVERMMPIEGGGWRYRGVDK